MRLERRRMGDPVDEVASVRALAPAAGQVSEAVAAIVEDVRRRGDDALNEYTRRFDTAGADPPEIVFGAAEGGFSDSTALSESFNALPRELRDAIAAAAQNIAAIADGWIGGERGDARGSDTGPEPREVTLPQGHRIVLREKPVLRAAVYVPGGRAPYPSTVLMGVMAAREAGVGAVTVCTPPGPPDGRVHPAILGACGYAGGVNLVQAGGAQAIAALAYGTESVGRVEVIVGPGNLYVQEAKRQVADVVGIDGFAGPSDLVIVVSAATELRPLALDLMAQAEHGEESLVVAVLPSAELTRALADEIETLSEGLDLRAPFVLLEADVDKALMFVDAFAPEHLQLVGEEAERAAERVRSAGCIFVGPSSGTAFGDYVAGSNHVLPTAGAARFASGLSPAHFLRRRAEVHLDPASAAALAPAGAEIARAEGFEVHARSMEARIDHNEGAS